MTTPNGEVPPDSRDVLVDLALCEAATPGPWEHVYGSVTDWKDGTFTTEFINNRQPSRKQGWANLDFVAAAREGWPWALREIERLRQDVAELRQQSLFLADILALIHRDGGHKQSEVGTARATVLAVEEVLRLRAIEANHAEQEKK